MIGKQIGPSSGPLFVWLLIVELILIDCLFYYWLTVRRWRTLITVFADQGLPVGVAMF